MILCAICGYWQHGVCFQIIDEEEAPVRHVCQLCASDTEPSTDPTLTNRTSEDVQVKHLFDMIRHLNTTCTIMCIYMYMYVVGILCVCRVGHVSVASSSGRESRSEASSASNVRQATRCGDVHVSRTLQPTAAGKLGLSVQQVKKVSNTSNTESEIVTEHIFFFVSF